MITGISYDIYTVNFLQFFVRKKKEKSVVCIETKVCNIHDIKFEGIHLKVQICIYICPSEGHS